MTQDKPDSDWLAVSRLAEIRKIEIYLLYVSLILFGKYSIKHFFLFSHVAEISYVIFIIPAVEVCDIFVK